MKKKLRKFSHFAIPTSIIALILSFFINTQIAIMLLCITLIIEADIIFKEKIRKELIIALLFALIVTSYYNYEYQDYNIKIGRINFYPLICWTAGLIILKEIYSGINLKYKQIIIVGLYIGILILLEYIFYHFLNIKLNANYSGIFGFDVLHAPTEMKIFYLSAGPVYLFVTNYLKIRSD